jgi:ABC-type nitrate/sulfonate/bicarbonate transport system permease component
MASSEQALTVAAAAGARARAMLERLLRGLRALLARAVIPVVAFAVFLGGWTLASHRVVTKYGTLPTPADVVREAGFLLAEGTPVPDRTLADSRS